MFGAPGSPHAVIAGRQASRAVTWPPAAPSSICARPAASLAMSVRVVSVCTGFSRADRTAAGTPGTPIASSSGCRSPASATAAALTESGFAWQPLDGADERVEVGVQGGDVRVELVLGVLGDGLRAAVGRLGDLGRQPRLRVVERRLETLRLREQPRDGVERVGHEGRGLVEARDLQQVEEAEQAEQPGHRPGQERRRVERAGVERRGRVAALPDRAERPGDALHGQVGRDEPAGPVRPAGEVHGGRGALEGEDQLAGVGRAGDGPGVERSRRQAVRQVRLRKHEVDGRRLRGEVPHRRHDGARLGEERPAGHVRRVDLAVEDQVRDLDGRVPRLDRLRDRESLPAPLDLADREVPPRRRSSAWNTNVCGPSLPACTNTSGAGQVRVSPPRSTVVSVNGNGHAVAGSARTAARPSGGSSMSGVTSGLMRDLPERVVQVGRPGTSGSAGAR